MLESSASHGCLKLQHVCFILGHMFGSGDRTANVNTAVSRPISSVSAFDHTGLSGFLIMCVTNVSLLLQKIKIAALRMYTCCVERINYDEFFESKYFWSWIVLFFTLRPYYGLMTCSFKFSEELLNTPHFIRNVEMSVTGPFQQHLKDLYGTLQLCYVVFLSWGKNRCKPNSGFGIGARVCIGLATCCVFSFSLMMSCIPSLSPRVLSPWHAKLLVLGGTAPHLVSFWMQFCDIVSCKFLKHWVD